MPQEKVRVLHVITRLIRGGADENTVFTVEGVDHARFESEILAGCSTEIEGFSAPEIAEALAIKLNTVYSRLRVAREKFQRAFGRAQLRRGREP